MKPAFGIGRAHAPFQSLASFPAKRLSLVAETEMNGLNKEITRPVKLLRELLSAFVKHVS
jgi:hypothetical protein